MTDQRAQYNEYAIGAGHPSEPDVVNRLALIEHNTDGTHKVITLTVANDGNYIGATITQNDVTNNPDTVKIVNAGTGRGLLIDQNGAGRAILIDHDDTGVTPSLDIDRDGNNAAAIKGLWVNVANSGGGAAYAAIFEAGRVGVGTTAPVAELDMGAATSGRSIAWGGSDGTGWYATLGTMYSSADLCVLSGLKLDSTAAKVLYSFTGTYAPAAVVLDWSAGDIIFSGEASGAKTAGLEYNQATNQIAKMHANGLTLLKALRVGTTATDPGDGNGYIEGDLTVGDDLTVTGDLAADVWQECFYSVLSAQATSISCTSGLAGEADLEYLVECFIVGNVAATTVWSGLRFNNDSGANYGRQTTVSTSAGAGAGAANSETLHYLAYTTSNTDKACSRTWIKANYAGTLERVCLTSSLSAFNGTTLSRKDDSAGVWNNTADAITRIDLVANAANGLKAGSYMRIWKRVPN